MTRAAGTARTKSGNAERHSPAMKQNMMATGCSCLAVPSTRGPHSWCIDNRSAAARLEQRVEAPAAPLGRELKLHGRAGGQTEARARQILRFLRQMRADRLGPTLCRAPKPNEERLVSFVKAGALESHGANHHDAPNSNRISGCTDRRGDLDIECVGETLRT
jgi:hypothetical protein